ncbi:MAG: tetratricopeptide repeat protein [Flavobacteriales bacterium]
MKNIFFICLISCLGVQSYSSNDSLFLYANNLYENENYAEAINIYTSIIDSNYHSFELYFNLANSYYQFGKIPKSILFYEKALLLEKNNSDCLLNLKLAKERIDLVDTIPKIFYVQWWENCVNLLKPITWAVLVVVAVWLVVGLLILFLRFRKKIIFNLFISCLLTMTFCILSLFSSNQQKSKKYAIVMKDSNLYSSPLEAIESKTMKSGNKVIQLQLSNSLSEVLFTDGQTGWIEQSNIELIN